MKIKNNVLLIMTSFLGISVNAMDVVEEKPHEPVKKIKQRTDEIVFSEKEIEELIKKSTPLDNFNKPILYVDQKNDIIVRKLKNKK